MSDTAPSVSVKVSGLAATSVTANRRVSTARGAHGVCLFRAYLLQRPKLVFNQFGVVLCHFVVGRLAERLAGGEDSARVVVGGGAAVCRARWPTGAGKGCFRCPGGSVGLRAQVPAPSADVGGCQFVRLGRLLPGPAEVGGQRSGEPELGIGGDHEPGPSAGRFRVAKPGLDPPQGLLEQAKCVLDVEASQEGLPAAVDVRLGGAGARPPQLDRLVDLAAGQLLDDQADDGALDEGQRSVVVEPGRPAG